MTYSTPSPFPPSFEGNPWAYGFGLFGDVVAASLALAMLLAYLFEARRNREVDRLLRNPMGRAGDVFGSALAIHRMRDVSILLFIVMRALPDAVWMLVWGEVDEACIRFLLAFDLWLDGVALFPLLFAAGCWALGRQAIEQRLVGVQVVSPRERVSLLLWHHGRIVLAVVVIAVLVTIGKAGG